MFLFDRFILAYLVFVSVLTPFAEGRRLSWPEHLVISLLKVVCKCGGLAEAFYAVLLVAVTRPGSDLRF